jgi:hypothetical protein
MPIALVEDADEPSGHTCGPVGNSEKAGFEASAGLSDQNGVSVPSGDSRSRESAHVFEVMVYLGDAKSAEADY